MRDNRVRSEGARHEVDLLRLTPTSAPLSTRKNRDMTHASSSHWCKHQCLHQCHPPSVGSHRQGDLQRTRTFRQPREQLHASSVFSIPAMRASKARKAGRRQQRALAKRAAAMPNVRPNEDAFHEWDTEKLDRISVRTGTCIQQETLPERAALRSLLLIPVHGAAITVSFKSSKC